MLGGAGRSDFKLGRNASTLIDMYRDISVFYVDSVDVDKMLHDAADGMTKNLDPYTTFFSEEEARDFQIMTTGKYGGIGSLIRAKGDHVIIAQPYKGFPADKAGLQIGDAILSIDGADAQGMDVSKVSSLLKGDPGTTLNLNVKKFYTDEIVPVKIKREKITISGIPYYGMVSNGVGYIQHNDFSEGCSEDLRNAFMEMRKSGTLKGLIIDLRNNGGGVLQEAVKIVSFFTPKGTEVVRTRGRQAQANETFRTQGAPIDLDIPVVVLVSNSSASAAEIVAGALQDLDRAVVVGQRTFGKGLVQTTRPIGYNAMLKVTTAKYYIPSGRCIQAIDYSHRNENGSVGVVPDSLISEFKTRNGRKVYDGGGVTPDVASKLEYVSRFAVILFNRSYIDDFADLYCKAHPRIDNPDSFHLTDSDYADFVEFMADKDVDYRSETKSLVEQLKRKAEAERYLDKIADDIASMERHIRDDKQSSLAQYRKEIENLIEEQVVLRGYYAQGVTKRRLLTDTEVAEAVAILGDKARYTGIVTSQDTARK
jgi:carboxyl-terminal processing protease